MNIKSAAINWKNFLRQAVGLSKIYPVKVKRLEAAKKYPLIHASKKGDVGYNLPAIENLVIPAATESAVHNYNKRMALALKYGMQGDDKKARMWTDAALSQLPKAVIPTGIHLEMPEPIWCSIEARSSSSNKMLITPDAIIDTGYVGELFIVIYNFGYMDHQVMAGDMLAQIIFHERIDIRPYEVNELRTTERGVTGFGSTGNAAKEVK